jgi:hypothetical protein
MVICRDYRTKCDQDVFQGGLFLTVCKFFFVRVQLGRNVRMPPKLIVISVFIVF